MSISSITSKLDDLVGLDHAKAAVRRLARSEHVARAVLLHGPDGVGKRILARYLASAWMCLKPIDGQPCGACGSCTAIEAETNADLFVVAPEGAGGFIKINQISDGRGTKSAAFPVQSFIRTMPIQSRSKVVIFESAHRMNWTAQNAMLKDLEEPHAYLRHILSTSQPMGILTTVRSRCVPVACGAPDQTGDDGLRLTPGRRVRYQSRGEVLGEVRSIAAGLLQEPRSAMRLADRFRQIIDEAAEEDQESKRNSQLEFLELLAESFRSFGDLRSARATADAHLKIRQNGQFPMVLDALFAHIGAFCAGSQVGSVTNPK